MAEIWFSSATNISCSIVHIMQLPVLHMTSCEHGQEYVHILAQVLDHFEWRYLVAIDVAIANGVRGAEPSQQVPWLAYLVFSTLLSADI
jgi:hypothetical protein